MCQWATGPISIVGNDDVVVVQDFPLPSPTSPMSSRHDGLEATRSQVQQASPSRRDPRVLNLDQKAASAIMMHARRPPSSVRILVSDCHWHGTSPCCCHNRDVGLLVLSRHNQQGLAPAPSQHLAD